MEESKIAHAEEPHGGSPDVLTEFSVESSSYAVLSESLVQTPTHAEQGPSKGSSDKAWHDNLKRNSDGKGTSTAEIRENFKDGWLSLSEGKRRSPVTFEIDAVVKRLKDHKKHSCQCTGCMSKLFSPSLESTLFVVVKSHGAAIEEEAETLYKAYYDEIEAHANYQGRYEASDDVADLPSLRSDVEDYDDDDLEEVIKEQNTDEDKRRIYLVPSRMLELRVLEEYRTNITKPEQRSRVSLSDTDSFFNRPATISKRDPKTANELLSADEATTHASHKHSVKKRPKFSRVEFTRPWGRTVASRQHQQVVIDATDKI
ncbi:hypothetical protein CONPUDRAFT_88638 [Coniophora puteana RWD-64-598 SS2]|uniref:Stress response protein NST1 n=1 Tax=Coniophora puteana (strain RWD-64-598) TaxID=741705 RepID=A0A5M3MZ21_CONPW|nr:uncharacterized protein CONPUDRAFT_88638 [Coniophora puteana RWD-64-598 SS2]EIW84390.1 hypothetical protein CONPUDRAFT_88638 [Coniophora puteana RWD-64-598 SS2]